MRSKTQYLFLLIFLIVLLGIGLQFNPVLLGEGVQSEDWAYFHGPRGDNISKEKGLLPKWPEAGPELLWTAKDLGIGYSSVVIANQTIFTAGSISNQTYVIALDYGGNLKWKKPNGNKWVAGNMHWAKDYDGARATPTFSDGLVYHLGEMGILTAFKAATGSKIWSINIVETFSGQLPRYGYSESLLVDGDNLICYPGGSKGYMVALKRKNGKTVWANTDIKDAPGYDSPILIEDQGIRQIITMTTMGVIGVNADNGQLLWRIEHTNKRKLNIANPVYQKGYVCISSGYGSGTMLIKLTYQGKKIDAKKVWFNDQLDNHHGGIMFLDGYIHGTGHNKRGWFCLDFKTGNIKYREGGAGKGSFMYADGLFYYLTERGKMNLVKPSNESFKVISTFQVPKGGKGLYWAHPVVCNGRLYLRHDNKLFAYKIKE